MAAAGGRVSIGSAGGRSWKGERTMSESPDETRVADNEEDRYEAPVVEDFGDVVDLTLGSGGATPDGSAFTTWGSY
jgi:hypothetical protein